MQHSSVPGPARCASEGERADSEKRDCIRSDLASAPMQRGKCADKCSYFILILQSHIGFTRRKQERIECSSSTAPQAQPGICSPIACMFTLACQKPFWDVTEAFSIASIAAAA